MRLRIKTSPNGRPSQLQNSLSRCGHELKEIGDEVIERHDTNDMLVDGFDGTFGICLCC